MRWALLLGPVCLVLMMVRLRHLSHRTQIAGLFAFLYGVAMVFVTHSFAIWMGWWSYGWDALMVNALPADIILGGAVLFGLWSAASRLCPCFPGVLCVPSPCVAPAAAPLCLCCCWMMMIARRRAHLLLIHIRASPASRSSRRRGTPEMDWMGYWRVAALTCTTPSTPCGSSA